MFLKLKKKKAKKLLFTWHKLHKFSSNTVFLPFVFFFKGERKVERNRVIACRTSTKVADGPRGLRPNPIQYLGSKFCLPFNGNNSRASFFNKPRKKNVKLQGCPRWIRTPAVPWIAQDSPKSSNQTTSSKDKNKYTKIWYLILFYFSQLTTLNPRSLLVTSNLRFSPGDRFLFVFFSGVFCEFWKRGRWTIAVQCARRF